MQRAEILTRSVSDEIGCGASLTLRVSVRTDCEEYDSLRPLFLRLSNEWFARPVLFVADIDRSVDFYVKQLGFSQPWRYEEEGKARVAQVERQGCALILSSQWPDKVGKGLIFISLDVEVLNALRGAGRKGRGREGWALGLQAHGHRGPRPQRALLSLPVGRQGNLIKNPLR